MNVSTRCLFPNFSLVWLSGNNEPSLLPTSFFPKLTPEIIKELDLENGIETSMSAFLLEAEGKKALFDVGLSEESHSGILQRLEELKIKADDIDYIFITHFHLDHVGGFLDSNDNIVFKNAKVYVPKEEYDEWINNMPSDKNALQVKIMKIYEKQVVQFTINDTLPLGIKPIAAYGHTAGHTIYRKDDLLIIGDLMHGEKFQFKYPEICAFFDQDESKSIETRKNILKYAEDNKLLLAGMHLRNSNSSMYRDFYKK